MSKKTKIEGLVYLAGFIATIFLANYLIGNVGTECHGTTCLIPVWFNPVILAPSGVLAIGLGFTLRDLVQRRLGVYYALVGVLVGAGLSAFLSPALALASGVAFGLSETLDLFVYTPLRKRNLYMAVVASNVVGLVVDSVVFLSLAFGSLQFIEGQVIGKLWMTLLAIPVVKLIERADTARGLQHA